MLRHKYWRSVGHLGPTACYKIEMFVFQKLVKRWKNSMNSNLGNLKPAA